MVARHFKCINTEHPYTAIVEEFGVEVAIATREEFARDGYILVLADKFSEAIEKQFELHMMAKKNPSLGIEILATEIFAFKKTDDISDSSEKNQFRIFFNGHADHVAFLTTALNENMTDFPIGIVQYWDITNT